MIQLSVVVPTFNRPGSLRRLLVALCTQTLDPTTYEVVVVDDGSVPPAAEALEGIDLRCRVRLIRQPNAGAAAARDRGARVARGPILVFVDDDMEVGPGFLEGHLRAHAGPGARVVLGRMRPVAGLAHLPLFERFHAHQLAAFETAALGGAPIPPVRLSTGNVSLRRADFIAAGGFDPGLDRSEDRDLGVRLGMRGLSFTLVTGADTVHASDHTSLSTWLTRAYRYGRCDLAIARKYREVPEADPWGLLARANPLSWPLLAAAVGAPALSRRLPAGVMAAAQLADRLGLERLALAGTTTAFNTAYFRGLREESGALFVAGADLVGHLVAQARGGQRGPVLRAAAFFSDALAADARAARRDGAGERFLTRPEAPILALIRAMQAAHRAGRPRLARALSSALGRRYGSRIHWAADLSPGLRLASGQGLSIGPTARTAPGVRLGPRVTLGDAVDPGAQVAGAPTLEADVEVGAGATLLGPITVGAGARIGPGVVLTRPLAPGAVAVAPGPVVVATPPEATPGKQRRQAHVARAAAP